MDIEQELKATLARMQSPSLPVIEMSLGRVLRLLEALGHPQHKLPPVIHVAGTNGKGSLLAYLEAIYQGAGYRVHRYISPHLLRFNERIRLCGKDIDDTTLLTCLKRVEALLPTHPATFFEATTAAAFLAFCEHPADILLLETGMGGRLDATNVVAKPALTAIMPVGMDHTEFLGNMLEKIAAEKAGIIKQGVSCVVSAQEPQAQAVLEARAKKLAAPVHTHGRDWHVESENQRYCYSSAKLRVPLRPSLAGEHQFANAATAVACCEQLLPLFPLTSLQIESGIASAFWPARLQYLQSGKLAKALPTAVGLWLDGGHNPHAAEVIAHWAQQRGRPLALICAMLANKDAASFLRILSPHACGCVTLTIPCEPGSHRAQELAHIARQSGLNAAPADGLAEALLQAADLLPHRQGDVLICGSLYFAGEVLRQNGIATI